MVGTDWERNGAVTDNRVVYLFGSVEVITGLRDPPALGHPRERTEGVVGVIDRI